MPAPAHSPAPSKQGHAVVIGASIAGLLAARGLSDAFAKVTVTDRDALPDGPGTRRGVPQSRQAHILLARGAQVFDKLFTGFTEEMAAAGATVGDALRDTHWYLDGHLLYPATSGMTTYGVSRPLIEDLARRRVAALPGVEIIGSTEVLGLVTTDDRLRATGVRVRPLAGDAEESTISADLVVDASGRGSRALNWLQELGHPRPPESRVHTGLVYLTRHYRREPHHLDGRQAAAIVIFPGTPRGGAVASEEGERFAVVLVGMFGEEPPTDQEGMEAFADTLGGPDVAEVLRSATPLDEAVRMRYPASVRHHYEKLDRYLDGFLVIGDALCSFNPTYGQGMTVAADEALLLQRLLTRGTDQLPRRFFRAAAKIVNTPWSLAAGGDLRFPEAEGKRQAGDGLLNAYLDRYRVAASVDPVLARTFIQVAHLTAPPTRLLSPGHLIRVFRGAKKGARARSASPALHRT